MTTINGKSFDEMSLTERSMVVMLVGDLLDVSDVAETYEITIKGQRCDLGRLARWIDVAIDDAHARGRQDERAAIKQTILASVAELLDQTLPERETP